MSYIYTKFIVIKEAENPYWLFNNFAGTLRVVDGRISNNSGANGNYQLRHPSHADWHDVKPEFVRFANYEEIIASSIAPSLKEDMLVYLAKSGRSQLTISQFISSCTTEEVAIFIAGLADNISSN
jgi:hypothetical protein